MSASGRERSFFEEQIVLILLLGLAAGGLGLWLLKGNEVFLNLLMAGIALCFG